MPATLIKTFQKPVRPAVLITKALEVKRSQTLTVYSAAKRHVERCIVGPADVPMALLEGRRIITHAASGRTVVTGVVVNGILTQS